MKNNYNDDKCNNNGYCNGSNVYYYEIKKAGLALNSLSIYRNILNSDIIVHLQNLIDYLEANPLKDTFDLGIFTELYNKLYFELVNTNGINYNGFSSLKQYVTEWILFDENIFTKQAEKFSYNELNPLVKNSVSNDLGYLGIVCQLSCEKIKHYVLDLIIPDGNIPYENIDHEDIDDKYIDDENSHFEKAVINNLPDWNSSLYYTETCCNEACSNERHFYPVLKTLILESSWAGLTETLAKFHNKWGYGDFARFRAFVWYNGNNNTRCLKGIENPDPIKLIDLIGYKSQRNEVINNTLLFLRGFPANNMLLYGDRGTGKSSTIKAIVNEYYEQGLRIVETPKKHLMDFPDIIRALEDRNQKFIIFIDDLAFEDNEENYTALKAILEGGVESKPSNIIIYATSNRRHLIKEKFSDRAGLGSNNLDEEIHASDTIQEKLSLADRFGIKVTFSAPDKYEFLEIVDGMAEKRGLKVDKEYLHREALKWELTYNGRSPRTAKQFIDWLEGNLKVRDNEHC